MLIAGINQRASFVPICFHCKIVPLSEKPHEYLMQTPSRLSGVGSPTPSRILFGHRYTFSEFVRTDWRLASATLYGLECRRIPGSLTPHVSRIRLVSICRKLVKNIASKLRLSMIATSDDSLIYGNRRKWISEVSGFLFENILSRVRGEVGQTIRHGLLSGTSKITTGQFLGVVRNINQCVSAMYNQILLQNQISE